MSPVEYIQWRFSGGLDKEQQAMEAAQMSDEEKEKLRQPFVVYLKELAAELDESKRQQLAQAAYQKGTAAINKFIEIGNDGMGLQVAAT